jgi:hypothetical protein
MASRFFTTCALHVEVQSCTNFFSWSSRYKPDLKAPCQRCINTPLRASVIASFWLCADLPEQLLHLVVAGQRCPSRSTAPTKP